MLAVNQLGERAVGERRRHVAICTSRLSRRSRTRSKSARRAADVASSPRAAPAPRSANRDEHGQAEERRVGSDFGVELRADARERFVELERAEIAAALVQHVAGHRRQALAAGGSATTRDESATSTLIERHRAVLDRPHPETVVERSAPDLGNGERQLARAPAATAIGVFTRPTPALNPRAQAQPVRPGRR